MDSFEVELQTLTSNELYEKGMAYFYGKDDVRLSKPLILEMPEQWNRLAICTIWVVESVKINRRR